MAIRLRRFLRNTEPLPCSVPPRSTGPQYSSEGGGTCAGSSRKGGTLPPPLVVPVPSRQGPDPYVRSKVLEQFSLRSGIVLRPRETGTGTNTDFPARDSSRSNLARLR